MRSRLETLIELLHGHGDAALATHSAAMPGYPLATAMIFATDEHHRPVLLISTLAEHTRNLMADPRASFLVARVMDEGEIARVSLVGEVLPIEADARLVGRFLRFHPPAERFLHLADFRFYRFEPERALVVSGFGKAGWLDGQQLLDAPHIALDLERQLVDAAAPSMPPGTALLGVDAYGADLSVAAVRRRITFAMGPVAAAALPATLARELAP